MNSFPGSNGKNHELMKKLFFFIAIAVFTAMVGVANNIQIRKVLSGKERDSIEIFELPGFGLSANLAGDSVMLLDFEDLPIIHIPAKADARQIIVCDSTIYGAVDNAIYADTCSVPVMILDNQEFRIYPATTETFYVCTSDSTWSSLMLVNPKVGLYSEVTAIDRPIDKVVANDEHTFAIMKDQVVALGANNEIAPLYQSPALFDIALSPIGMFIATGEGLFLAPKLSDVQRISSLPFSRVWWFDSSLYLQDMDGNILAIDEFSL